MSLCQYRDIFGAPNTGAHSWRAFEGIHGGFAVVDFVLTILGALLIARMTGAKTHVVLFVLFVVSIALHWLLCVPTTTNILLGLE